MNDFEPRERGDDGGPGRAPDLCGLAGLRLIAADHDADSKTYPVTFDVLELGKRLLGEVDGLLRWRGGEVRKVIGGERDGRTS